MQPWFAHRVDLGTLRSDDALENGAERPSQWNLLGRNGMFGDKP